MLFLLWHLNWCFLEDKGEFTRTIIYLTVILSARCQEDTQYRHRRHKSTFFCIGVSELCSSQVCFSRCYSSSQDIYCTTTRPDLQPKLRKQESHHRILYRLCSSSPLVDYVIRFWVQQPYLAAHHTSSSNLLHWLSIQLERRRKRAYNLSRISKPLTWSILPLIFSSRIRETTNPSASGRVTLRDCYQLGSCMKLIQLTLARNWSSSLVYGLIRSMMNCVRRERRRSLMK